jgi:hypothetical protein
MRIVVQIPPQNLIPSTYRNATLTRMNAFGQEDVPARFVPVDSQNHFSRGGWVFDRVEQPKKVRAHVDDGKGVTVEQEAHLNFRRMAVSLMVHGDGG